MSLFARTKVKPPASVSYTYSATGGFAVNLGWTTAISAWPTQYYIVYRDGEEIATGLTSTSYRDATAQEGASYNYFISTVNIHEIESVGQSSQAVSLPSFPVWQAGWSLSIDQNTTASVAVRASDPNGVALTFSKAGGTAPSSVTVSSAGVVTVGSTAGGAYTLIVRASNGTLASDYTANLVVTTPITAPNPPVNFTANAASSSMIDLLWAKSATGIDPTDYDVDWSLTGTGNWNSLPIGLQTSYQHSGLSANTTYYYRVRAGNSGQYSGYTTVNEATFSGSVYAAADFETGNLSPYPTTFTSPNRLASGLYISTVAKVMTGITGTNNLFEGSPPSGSAASTTRGFGPNSQWDTHVVASETVTGVGPTAASLSSSPQLYTDVVTPRSGNYFLRTAIYRAAGGLDPSIAPNYTDTEKHYDGINGQTTHTSGSGSNCKPRSAFGMQLEQDIYGWDWDCRIFAGFSIYVPRSFENEQSRKGQTGNAPVIVETYIAGNVTTTPYEFGLLIPVPTGNWQWRAATTDNSDGALMPSNTQDTHWFFRSWTNPNGTGESGATQRYIALAPLGTGTGAASDRGKWTDFVFEMCFNPFTTATTVNGVSCRGNTGLVRIWKSTGAVDANGNRSMSETANYVSGSQGGLIYQRTGPFGPQPYSATQFNRLILRSYCFGLRPDNPTSLVHHRWLGIDEVRYGFAENRAPRNMMNTYQSGVATTFDDVVPRS